MNVTAVTPRDSGQRGADHGHSVAKASLLAIASVASGISSILVAAGVWGIQDGTIRYALTVLGIVATAALAVAGLFILISRR
jgi:hypothetical protein